MIVSPLPFNLAPVAEDSLDHQQFEIRRWPIDRLTTVVPAMVERTLIELIEGGTKPGLPLVVIHRGLAYLYDGVEGVVAKMLLGEDEVIVKILRTASS